MKKALPWWLVLAVFVVSAVAAPWWSQMQSTANFPVTAADLAAGEQSLQGLTVVDRTSLSGYERDLFGDGWADLDSDGCRTRDEILQRDLTGAVLDDNGCTVLSGELADPYTGETIEFTRGENSADVQIDHVVALADAWRSGARDWNEQTRLSFANDPANLLAVDGPANQSKGASNASDWLPTSGYECAYALRQVAVKAAYGLSVTSAEKDALADALDTCHTS